MSGMMSSDATTAMDITSGIGDCVRDATAAHCAHARAKLFAYRTERVSNGVRRKSQYSVVVSQRD